MIEKISFILKPFRGNENTYYIYIYSKYNRKEQTSNK